MRGASTADWVIDTDGSPTGTLSSAFEPCGNPSYPSNKGLRVKGSGFTRWGISISRFLVSVRQPVDLSGFDDVGVFIFSPTITPVLLKFLNPYAYQECGNCNDTSPESECFSGFVANLFTTSGNDARGVMWSDLKQQTWGYRPPGVTMLDPSNVVAIALFIDQTVGSFDICLEDVLLSPLLRPPPPMP